jgi:hypothetical protein
MPLPEGRKPLSDKDMIDLLRNMAAGLGNRDDVLQDELQQTADRLNELAIAASVAQHKAQQG